MKILITGDTYLGSEKLQKAAERGHVDEIFGHYLEHIQNSDLVITNLESPITDEGDPITKTGPCLRASKKSLDILKKAGFNLLTLANNHIRDYGQDGIFSTLETCETLNLNYVGAGENLRNAKETFYYKQGSCKVGIINIAENEYGTTNGNFPGAHPLNEIENYYSIQNAKLAADKVVVIVHGGHELYAFPSPRIKKLYRFFVDAGADAVISHHPHWSSGYESYKNAPIFYSLGNFLFENKKQVNSQWNIGYGVLLDISNEPVSFRLLPYNQCGSHLGIRPLSDQEQTAFDEHVSFVNTVISNDGLLEKEFSRFCKSKRRLYDFYLEPHSFYILRKLQRLGIIPSLWSASKKKLLLNLIKCESHRDIVLKSLK